MTDPRNAKTHRSAAGFRTTPAKVVSNIWKSSAVRTVLGSYRH